MEFNRIPAGVVSTLGFVLLGPLAGVLVLVAIPDAFGIASSCLTETGTVTTAGDVYVRSFAVLGTLGWLVVRSGREPVKSGVEGLRGATGTVVADFEGGRGQVRVEGAIWSARCAESLVRGDSCKISEVHGLELVVMKQTQDLGSST